MSRNRSRRTRRSRRWLLATAVSASALTLPVTAAGASDHLDAPGLTPPGGSGETDVADLYAFQSPSNPDNAVLIATYNPLAGVASPTALDPEVIYSFQVDNDGDAVMDISLDTVVGAAADDGTQPSLLASSDGSRWFPTVHAVSWDSAEGQSVGDGGWHGIGLYDDPFFFDLNAFTAAEGRGFCDGGEADFFAGANVTGIVAEVPRDVLGADNVGVWATTRRGGEQIDRVGRPAIATVFIASEDRAAYNSAAPADDAANYADALGDFAGVLLPDVLTVDLSLGDGFLNGRGLADDVIDIELQVISGDETAGDCVDGNDVEFSTTAPYLAPAHEG